MGLETDITDIQSLNQNWPPVSDPRAQGADHIRNIKKAIQLTFPNLKQCLLNDAQFTALGTLIGDGSGTFTINGKLTVSDTLTVPTVTDWTTQQAVGAKDAEGRYLKPGDADGRYLKPGDADGRYIKRVSSANTDQDFTPYWAGVNRINRQIWFSYKDDKGAYQYAFAQPAGDYATNAALNTETTNRTNADTDLQNQINNRVQKTGDTMSGLLTLTGAYGDATGYSWSEALLLENQVSGSTAQILCTTQYGVDTAVRLKSTWGNNKNTVLDLHQDGTITTTYGTVAFQSDLPFSDKNLRVQVFDAVATNGNFVKIPQAFKTLVGVTAQQHSSGGVGIIPIRIETNVFRGDGFNVSIWAEGGNIQYTFVAYGYF